MKIGVQKIGTLAGHRDCVYTLEKYQKNTFFSAAGDGLVAEWDLNDPENGKLIAKLDHSVYALCYVQERQELFIGHNLQGIHQIDLLTKKEIASVKITDSNIFDIQYHQQKIWVACGDGTLIILEAEGLKTIQKIKLSDKSIRTLAINSKKNEIAAGYSDFCIRVFDLVTFSLKNDWQAHQNSVFCLTYSPDNQYLLSGSRDAHLKIWQSENYVLQQNIVAHLYTINDIFYSPDGKKFATCSKDKSVKIWDSQTFQLLKVIDKGRYAGHGTSVNRLLWTDFNDWLISCSDDHSVSVWELKIEES
ncbi:MAG: WD40 repeat domain-containing protein [Bacteroidetes bacterium]|nr:MAG: WD40 repeat domain-containing protein [Bacteroidota bacterium]